MSTITVRHRSTKKFPQNSVVIDVTSKSPDERFRRFSPFHPVEGGIVVPDGYYEEPLISSSVEGAWQGLKVFENEGVNLKALNITNMKGLKRNTSKARGRILGHGLSLTGYRQSREELYIPMYLQQMDALEDLIQEIVDILKSGKNVILLDYNTNMNAEDMSKPLSHASLIARRVIERMT